MNQEGWTAVRVRWAECTVLARISSAVLIQANGFGSSL
jgi:hypothetical protein